MKLQNSNVIITKLTNKTTIIQKPNNTPTTKKTYQNITINKSNKIITITTLSSINNITNTTTKPIPTSKTTLISTPQNSIIPKITTTTNIKTKKPIPNIIYIYNKSKLPQIHKKIKKTNISKSFSSPHNITILKNYKKISTNNNPQIITPITNQIIINKKIFKYKKYKYSTHNRNYLKQHIDLIHNTIKLYKYPFYNYTKKKNHSLKKHLIIHSNKKPYTYPHYNTTFRKKNHLTNHEKLHKKSIKYPIYTK